MPSYLWSGRAAFVMAWFCPVVVVNAATPFYVDDFHDGMLAGWSGGASPTVIPTGGPTGAGDAFLQLTSMGGFGPGSSLATVNETVPWVGDYAAVDIEALMVDMMVPASSNSLEMRLVLHGPNGLDRWTSSQSQAVPNDGVWRSYVFRVAESEQTHVVGDNDYQTTITGMSRIMLRHDSGTPSQGGTPIVAMAGFDNIRLVPGVGCGEFDALVAAIVAGANDPAWDLNRDQLVNLADLTVLRTIGGQLNLPSGNPYLPGDANLNGAVDGSDFGIWNSSKFTNSPGWCAGDFNANGAVDGSDFGVWNAYKFASSDGVAAVPEPLGGGVWRVILLAPLLLRASPVIGSRGPG